MFITIKVEIKVRDFFLIQNILRKNDHINR